MSRPSGLTRPAGPWRYVATVVIGAGGDFAMGFRMGAADAVRKAAAGAAEHRHFPYARPERTGWHQSADGTWEHRGEDAHRWEVVCAECGDTGGPFDLQPEPARLLRGPYKNRRHAKHVATAHFEAN